MSHIHGDEGDRLVEELSGRYELVDRYNDQDAAAALFSRKDQGE